MRKLPKHNGLLAALVLLMMTLGAVPAAWAQKTYLVAVGLNNYEPGGDCTPLPCSVGDARAISKFFNSYNGSDVFMLKDDNATREHILRVLKAQFAKSGPEDEIIFCYSGHGFDGGITCYDNDSQGNTRVIFCSEIQEIMRNSQARRKMMFINSCHSGSFTKKYGSDPRTRDYKSTNSNVLLYLSSRPEEVSWENTGMSQSYFYDRLLSALRGAADKNGDDKVTARELFNYVNAGVIKDTNGKQHPVMYGKFPDDMVVVYVK